MAEPAFVVSFQQEQGARLLIDYLNSQGIRATYGRCEESYPHGVYVIDRNQLEAARTVTEDFVRNPADKKYQQAAWQHGQHLPSSTMAQGSLLKHLQGLRHTPFTALILLLCCAVYLGSLLGWFVPLRNMLIILPFSLLEQSHQWWRLFTPALLHFSAVHLVFNLIWWVFLGRQIELKFGKSALVVIFFVSAGLSNIGQLYVSGPNFGGLSGVVYALLGVVWLLGWLRPQWGIGLPKAMIGIMIGWLLLGYADLLWVNMANTAHTLGLLTGCLLGFVLTRMRKR